MRFLGIDYGTKRVGVAISDTGGKFAFPHGVFPNDSKLISMLEKLVREKDVGVIVVGDARSLSGAENPITREVEEFIRAFAAHSGIRVVPAWESWSSVEARRFTRHLLTPSDYIKGRARVSGSRVNAPRSKKGAGYTGETHTNDASAAAIILQRFLDTHATQSPERVVPPGTKLK
ncbi:hypothetical protein A2673_02715 [Candidatus Kaiserbacteria bacterium RIFCSPHIGHO2_01_FULL_50_13]|uniref:Putative pre-16S rRNA nuclease n=1 Tax=Candidatus Kaiserbacteria bacterium RIFCSPLOWO2_01_FULL_50_24 TaxID=1798507 RepID=A0A1F6ER97_9BACT|nr:MAG: hypothetical protein A2673_02715 [Candidatus Kaiserbacteria bacterium RIFCSPHIGHO2_01_FULL_50_13]OGG76140.1 MAG: hypothetical protein A3A34_01450 [Candidatus Kaiserbacteria bacterium RIFCSPLOWO2_01_FULL_50_24]OGG81183.1 MAG: hypothetical protein A3H74_01890 [Candidatus Kaiserbacteria bacterium RIFCSPLOWO2_02_FULL_51_13]